MARPPAPAYRQLRGGRALRPGRAPHALRAVAPEGRPSPGARPGGRRARLLGDRPGAGHRPGDRRALRMEDPQGAALRRAPHDPGDGRQRRLRDLRPPRGPGGLGIKNVDSLVARDWPDGLPPLRFELQVQHQLACLPSRAWGALGVLIGGNSLKIFEYERHPGAIARIERAVEEFWRSIAEDRPPEPDFDRDLPALEALYRSTTPGSVRDLRGHERLEELCAEYERARRDESAAERRK